DATLAENDFVVAAGEQVFSGEQEFFDGGRDAALKQHRFANLAEFAQEVEVLHVARPHLKDVDIRQHQLDLRDLHHFADDEQLKTITRFAQQFQAVSAESLKRIGRGAGLEGAAAENARSRVGDQSGDSEQLLAGFDRAGPGHDDDFLAADFNPVRKLDYGTFGAKIAAGQFVGRSDAVNCLHPRHHFDFAGVEIMRNADAAENGLALSSGAVDFKAELDQLIDHVLDLIFTGRILHCDNHEWSRFARPEHAGSHVRSSAQNALD